MNRYLSISSLFAAILIMISASCGNKKEEERQKQFLPEHNRKITFVTEAVSFSPDQFDGMRLFMKHCNKCHPGGEKGKGPSLNDKNLPNFLIHWQVRLGVGAMPDFSKDEISKEELEKITAFVAMMHDMEVKLGESKDE